MLVEIFKTHEAGLEWLVPSLLRRAANAYEQAGHKRAAADCWAAAHEASHAAGLYVREGDYARAAQLLFEAGRYADALENYRRWASRQSPESEDFVIARFGEAACLTLLRTDRSAARDAYRSARAQVEACDATLQRDTNATVRRTRSLVAARLWEALGAYGLHVGREDLLQLGYERALARYGEAHKTERVRVARAYLAAAGENRLLAQELEAWLAEWEQKSFVRRDTRPIVLIRVGRTFRLGDRVSIEPGLLKFEPQDTGYHSEVFADGGQTGVVTGGVGAIALKVRWDKQQFIGAPDDVPHHITSDSLPRRPTNERQRINERQITVLLDSFESIIAAHFLRVMEAPLKRFWVHQPVPERDADKRALERRDWTLVNPTTWLQRYADGKATEFEVSGRAVVLGDHGTLVVKRSESAGDFELAHPDTTLVGSPSSLEVFIPDRGSRKQWLKMRSKHQGSDERWEYEDWRIAGEMRIVDDEDPASVNAQAEIINDEWADDIFCPRCAGRLTEKPRRCLNCDYGRATPDALLRVMLDGKYRLVELIGESSWSAVYRAIDYSGAERECAIKTLKESYACEGINRRRFFELAGTGMQLRHPNIVSVYDFNMAKLPAPYFVMELVEGELLLQLMRREGVSGFGWRRAMQLILEICQAVGAAHRRNILHRHLMPREIFVLPPERGAQGQDSFNQRVKVMNFGYYENPEMVDTFWVTDLTQNAVIYMSPEQCRDESLTTRADVYSLGILLYELISGRPPFIAASAVAIARMHITEPPPPFHPSLEVAPWLEAVVMKALAKDPSERPADANALAVELQEFLTLFTELQGTDTAPGGV
jgi:serine/threonine-protein kinase